MSLVYVLNDPPKHGIQRRTFVLAARRGEHFSSNRVMKLTNDRMPDRIRDGVHSLTNGECPMLEKRGNAMSKQIAIAIAVSLWLPTIASAGDTAKTAIGSGMGGAAGAAVGGELGGKTGAVVGGAAGGAVGAAATTRGDGRGGAIVGGAIGGAAGAAVGHEAGGKTGAVVGAGVGAGTGAVIGRKLDGDGKPQTNKQVAGPVAVSTSAGHSAVDQGPCGWKKPKNHPGKGWAKGHSNAC